MTLRQLAILVIVALSVAFIITWGFPSRAQDVPACVDADEFVGKIKADGALEGPILEHESRHADKLRLVEFQGVLWVLLTNRGCLVVQPIALDYAKNRGEPA